MKKSEKICLISMIIAILFNLLLIISVDTLLPKILGACAIYCCVVGILLWGIDNRKYNKKDDNKNDNSGKE